MQGIILRIAFDGILCKPHSQASSLWEGHGYTRGFMYNMTKPPLYSYTVGLRKYQGTTSYQSDAQCYLNSSSHIILPIHMSLLFFDAGQGLSLMVHTNLPSVFIMVHV